MLLVILASMVSAFFGCLRACPASLAGWKGFPLTVALALCLGYCLANATAWVVVVRELGYRLPLADGIGLWIGCEAFRWLPGSVWSLGARSVEAAKRGVPVLVTMATIALELLMSVLSRVVLIAAVCAGYASSVGSAMSDLPWRPVLTAVTVLLVLGMVGWPWLKNISVVARCQGRWRELRTAFGDLAPRWPLLAVLLGYHLLIRTLQGVALWCVAEGMASEAQIPLGIAVGANAIAWLVGFFAVFAPGGLIVREAVLATVFAAWMGPAQAVTIAIAWRMLQIACEAMLFAAVWLRFPWSRRAEWVAVP